MNVYFPCFFQQVLISLVVAFAQYLRQDWNPFYFLNWFGEESIFLH